MEEDRRDVRDDQGPQRSSPAEELYYALAAEPFFRQAEGELFLEIVYDQFVAVFDYEPEDTEDDRAFAAVFTSEQPDLEDLLYGLYRDPNSFLLPDPGRDEAVPRVVVVDPSPTRSLAKAYNLVAATPVSDVRFAAHEVEARWRERGGGARGATADSSGPRGATAPDGNPGRPGGATGGGASLTLEPPSSVEQTRLAFAGAEKRALSREDRRRIREYESLTPWQKTKILLRTGKLPEPPRVGVSPNYAQLIPDEAEEILFSDQPGIVVIGANKGGVGKTTVSLNLAAALSKVAHPAAREWTEPLRVLLVEANYGNPDLSLRMRLPSGRVRGFSDYLDDRERRVQYLNDLDARGLARDPEGEKVPEPDVADYVTRHADTPFDVLLASGTEYDRSLEGRVTYEDLEALYDSAARHYDLIVVDLDKGTPGEENMRAEVSRFWLEEADVVYLICDRIVNSVEQAAHFQEDTVRYFGEIGRPEEVPSMVLLANKWKTEERAREDGEEDFLDRWLAAAREVEADPPIGAEGEMIPFLRIHHDDTVDQFALDRRAIALDSEGWRDDLQRLAADALQRITQRCRRQRLARELGGQ